MKEYSIDDIKTILRPKLGQDVPLLLFRILRIIGMRQILGETSGATLYMVGKQVGNLIGAKDLEDFRAKIMELKVGIPEVQIVDEDHLTVKLYECITCAGFAYTGEMFCDMESGIIAGLIETIYEKKAKSRQTKSWSVGFNYCEFEIFLY
ncbi:MAG TPA: V4R domain-containing protein [Syntrophorhabdaceae bacterium]|nr:V4R domain-containing protein [Syntrophorhabdaceae bacterium]